MKIITRIKITLVFLIISFCAANTFTQNTSAGDELEKYFKAARDNKSYSFDNNLIKSDVEKLLLAKAEYYGKDTLDKVRLYALNIIRKIGIKSENGSIRQKSVALLIDACRDKNSGVCGSASRYLTYFMKDDYTKEAQVQLALLLNEKPYHFNRIILLNGFVKPDNSKTTIQNIIDTDSTLTKKDRWSAKLALARMGDEKYVNYCVQKIQSMPINDDIVYELLPDLIYTRQPSAFSYLIKILNNDAKLCMSSNPDKEAAILCGYRVMEYLAPVIKDFPLQTDASGDIQHDDYDDALAIVRKWFEDNPEYEILTSNF